MKKKLIKFCGALFVGAIPVLPFLDIASFMFKSAGGQTFVSDTSRIIICVIFTLFAVGILQLMYRWAKLSSFAASIPGHMTAIGILGTFIGIFFGLYNFDVSDINKSVPLLLEGMKLAFTTSIAGLASSTVLRVTHTLIVSISNEPDPFGPDDGATVVNVPGFQDFSETTVAGLYTINKRVSDVEEKLVDIHNTLKEQNDILRKP